MKSFLRKIFLIGSVSFFLLTIGSGYWAIALHRYGLLVSVEVIAYEAPKNVTNAEGATAIRFVYTNHSGRQETRVSLVDSGYVPQVGQRGAFYLLDGPIEQVTNLIIPGDGCYPWTAPALFFCAMCILWGLWYVTPKTQRISQQWILGTALLLTLFIIYMSDSLAMVGDVATFVTRQRHISRLTL